jgi:hypothetical protein
MDAHDTLEEAASASDGSALIHPDDIARLIAQVEGQHSKRLRVTTGCRSVDEALEGGQECGIQGLCCVSGDKETGKTWVSLRSFARHTRALGSVQSCFTSRLAFIASDHPQSCLVGIIK